MDILNIVFWLLLGLFFLPLFPIPYHEQILGVICLVFAVIGISKRF